ncbi:MAG: alpha/beta hydrolase [Erysipelotrichales bacterium]|nr:alpha/beta hydrolase [Erysipelotrichales bacterium]
MAFEEFEMTFKDETKRRGIAWPVENAKANIVIATGMEEHARRYDDFATFLNKHGYSVYALDHYGQGDNVENLEELGRWERSGFRKTVNYIDELITKLRVTCKPTIIMGHSMGSFIVQDYIQRYSNHVSKAIICGSCGKQSAVYFADRLARVFVTKRNYNKKSKFFSKLTFGGYNKSIKNPRTPFDWLSVNEDNVDRYIEDPKCGYGSTCGFYKEFFKGLNRLHTSRFLAKIRKNLPILLIAGEHDPVGKNGKGVLKLAKTYKKYSIENVETIIYPNMRHEILNETGKEVVYEDILKFVEN